MLLLIGLTGLKTGTPLVLIFVHRQSTVQILSSTIKQRSVFKRIVFPFRNEQGEKKPDLDHAAGFLFKLDPSGRREALCPLFKAQGKCHVEM